jgi:hypothetical protein
VVPANERVEHVAPGLAEDVRGDGVELDAGVFERLVQPVDLAGALLDLRLAIRHALRQAPSTSGSSSASTPTTANGLIRRRCAWLHI